MPETPSPTVEFISIANEFRHEYVVEKSRFITTVYPCSTEEEAQAFIGRINKEFWDARHNCTAFALGPKQEQQRSSDNGEPSGTAGKPMLEVLKKTGITNIAVVVTRYFGGIKLGAGGLIRAYSHSVAETLRLAPKELHTIRTEPPDKDRGHCLISSQVIISCSRSVQNTSRLKRAYKCSS